MELETLPTKTLLGKPLNNMALFEASGMLVYVCVASKDATWPTMPVLNDWFLDEYANLVESLPQHTFLSPSALFYPLLPRFDTAPDPSYAAWKNHCRRLLLPCEAVVVIGQNWADSVGCTDELEMAQEWGKPVYFFG